MMEQTEIANIQIRVRNKKTGLEGWINATEFGLLLMKSGAEALQVTLQEGDE